MASSHTPWGAAALAAAFFVAGCTGTRRGADQTTPSPAAGDQGSPSASAEAGSARDRHTEADVRFMSAMIGHHAQAVVMARLAPSHGASPSVTRLAERIINGQEDEIATMQRWLRDRGEPVPEAGAARTKVTMQGDGHEHLMPGMLTEPQLERLAGATGPEFDRLFLTLMIQHHRGAVSMVRDLFASPGAAQNEAVFKFANDVHVDQSTEVARMERMLSALPAGGDPT